MLDIDAAIKHCLEVADGQDKCAEISVSEHAKERISQCATENRQLAEWLTELKEAKSIIRVCNRVLGYLLECEIESTSTRHEVKTLLKSITEYLSGGSENGS